MKDKPKSKTCYSRKCVVYEIVTGKRREFPSLAMAAAMVGCSRSFLWQIIRAGMNTHGYVVAYIEDEEQAIVKLKALQARPEYRKMKQKKERKLVPLRIDSKTIIYVPEEKATPEYAEAWRVRHETDARYRSTAKGRNDELNEGRE